MDRDVYHLLAIEAEIVPPLVQISSEAQSLLRCLDEPATLLYQTHGQVSDAVGIC